MNGTVTQPIAQPSQPVAVAQQCFSGTVQRRPEVGIPYAGTHLLLGEGGNVLASLVSSQVNLDALLGRSVTVCGFGQGMIEGVPALAVTEARLENQPVITGIFVLTSTGELYTTALVPLSLPFGPQGV